MTINETNGVIFVILLLLLNILDHIWAAGKFEEIERRMK